MHKPLFAALLTAASLLTLMPAQAGTPLAYRQGLKVADHKLTITYPGKPDHSRETQDTFVGDVTTDIWKYETRGGGVYSVADTDMPWLADTFAADERVFSGAVKKMMKRLDANKTGYYSGGKGAFERRLEFRLRRKGKDWVGKALMGRWEDHLLVVAAYVPISKKSHLERFFKQVSAR